MARHVPLRQCVVCRTRAPQLRLVRFTSHGGVWEHDGGGSRAPGRGAYLCSLGCAGRVAKNKRFAGLGAAATGVDWTDPSLCDGAADVYDSRVPTRTRAGAIRSKNMI